MNVDGRASASGVGPFGRRQDELVTGPRHGHVEQSSLLGERLLRRCGARPERLGQGEPAATIRMRKPAVDEPNDEDQPELQPLGAMHGQHRDRIAQRVGILALVTARVEQRVEMRREERDPVLPQQRSLPAEPFEEAREVAQRHLVTALRTSDEFFELAVALQVPEADIPGRRGVRCVDRVANLADQTLDASPRVRVETQNSGLLDELPEHRPQRSVAATRQFHDRREVLPAERIGFGGRNRVQVDRSVRVGQRPQQCQD